jgi:hypothetical protein
MCVLSAFGAVVWLGLRPLPAPWALLGGVPAALAYALCLAAVQWLPALGLLGESVRSGYPDGANTFWSLHPGRVVELLLPIELGPLALSPSAREWLFEGREPFLTSLYLGAGAAFLVAVALLTPRGAASRRVRVGLAVGLTVSLGAALGRHTPFYSLLLTLPPVALIRYPVKFTLLAVVFWSLLAGLGFDTLRAAAAAARSRLAVTAVTAGLTLLAAGEALWPDLAAGWFLPGEEGVSVATLLSGTRAAAGVLLVGGALAAWAGRAAAASSLPLLAMLGLVAADLVASGRTVNPLAPPELLTHRPPILDGLADAGEVRLFVDHPGRAELLALLSRGPAGWEPEPRWALGAIEMLRPPIGARLGIDGSYDGDLTGLLPVRLYPLEVTARTRGEEALRLLRRSAVTHVITLSGWFDRLGWEASEWPSVFSEPIRLAALPGTLPRAFAVDGVRVLREPDSYAVLTDAAFDPLREVILPEGAPRAAAPGFRARVRLVERSLDRVVLDAELSGTGHVVLLDGFADGWQARVDGSPAPVIRANVAFRAVPVPGGTHRVVLAYRPREVFLGAGLSAAAALVGFGIAWAGRGRRS